MHLNDFLRACAETERLVGSLYGFLAEHFARRPQASQTFRQLALEEEGHARTFEFLRSLASHGEHELTVRAAFRTNLERLRKGLEKARASVGADDDAALLDALGIAILLESTTLERDKGAFVEVHDREFQNLLHGLVVSDQHHRKHLEELRDRVEKGLEGPSPPASWKPGSSDLPSPP